MNADWSNILKYFLIVETFGKSNYGYGVAVNRRAVYILKKMAAMECKPCEVAGLYSLVDLQKLCRNIDLKLSEESNDEIIFTILKTIGPKLASKAVHKCKVNFFAVVCTCCCWKEIVVVVLLAGD